jgi:asparagine synthase (glutamine-hydrolysing)
LAVIDLSSTGRQPLSDESESTWVTFNGEIYNFVALRDRLISNGHQFRTNTDTEILPHLFEDGSPAHLKELDGMYAFGIWNESRRQLLLARDPFGKKPLYYAEGAGWFAFASELQALRKIPEFDATIDRNALSLYLLTGYVPAPFTIFRGAKKLLPGHYLLLESGSSDKHRVKIDRHADFCPQKCQTIHRSPTNLKELRSLVIQAVQKRLVSDVSLGAFLSGGVDSSLVAAIATRELGKNLKTFTLGFKGAAGSEHLIARKIATHLGTDHHEKILQADAVFLIDEIADRLDEPNGDSSCLPTFLLSRYAKESVTVALSGDGGDELFGGYGRYRDTLNECGGLGLKLKRCLGLERPWSPSVAYLSPRWLIFQPSQVERLLGRLPMGAIENLESWKQILENRNQSLIHRMRYLDAHTYLPGAVLAKVDRMSMQVSLEVRCPLLDQKIRGFAEKLSARDCWAPPNQTKRILKRLACDYLPAEWMNQPKVGFGLPPNAWSKKELMELAVKKLLGKEGVLRELVDFEALQELVLAQVSESRFSIYQIWPLLLLELWLAKKM